MPTKAIITKRPLPVDREGVMVMMMAMAMVMMDDYGDDGVDDESICLEACRSALKTLLKIET